MASIRILSCVLLTTSLPLLGMKAFAQEYPSKQVRIVVPNPPGGTADLLARMISKGMQAQTGASVIVENRPGASGLTAATSIVRSTPDGYTLFLTHEGPVTILPAFRKETPYDPQLLSPISMVISMPFYMVVNSRLGVRNLKDFIAVAMKRSDPIYFSSTGVGGPSHLLTEQFANQTGSRMRHIPYQGGPQAFASLLNGEVDVFFSVPSTALSHLKDKETVFIAVTSDARTADAPDVATFLEQGLQGFETGAWFGLFGPPGMTSALRTRVQGLMRNSFNDPDAKNVISKLGAVLIADPPDNFQKTVKSDLARWSKLSNQLKLSLD